jgi:MoxR-like ATPase
MGANMSRRRRRRHCAIKNMNEKLVFTDGAGAKSEFVLPSEGAVIGSDPACSLVLPGDGVLPRHARIERNDGTWLLTALDPARPVESGGQFLSELRLRPGVVFSIGRSRLRFAAKKALLDGYEVADEGSEDPGEAASRLAEARSRIVAEIGNVIVGQRDVLDQILVALFARGHCLIVGVPGLAKTFMVRAVAGVLDLDFNRIQFTPDLMPADITGTNILEENTETGARRFRFNKGPVFANLLLADEINRTPPKTQAALLEAMQERRVTASGATYDLPDPFMVLATQNPIEQEGTYPLPEAQLDRFMFSIHIGYPDIGDERKILLETTRDKPLEVERILSAEDVTSFQKLARRVPVSEHVALYAANIIRATRPDSDDAPDFVSRWVRWGAGPRAGQYLLLAAKTRVILDGRYNVSCGDVREYALPVLRHRILCNFAAAGEGITADEIARRVLDHVKEPDYRP